MHVKFNFEFNTRPRCFWKLWTPFSRKVRLGWITLIFFLENKLSFAILFRSGLEDIFHWWAHLLMQSNLYKTPTLGTTQKWSPWAGGCLIKHLYKTTTKQMLSSLAGFLSFSQGNICLVRFAIAHFGAVLED